MDPWIRLFWEGRTTEEWLDPRRRIYDTELVYVSEGEYRIELNGAEHTLRAGDLVLVPPDLLHESWVEPGGYVVRHCIHFAWTRASAERKPPLWSFEGEPFNRAQIFAPPRQHRARLPLVSRVQRNKEIRDVLELALRHFRLGDGIGELLLPAVLRYLLEDRSAPAHGPVAGEKSAQRLFALKSFIDRHYARDIGYAEFCRTSQLSQAHLCDAFRRLIGRPPMEYLSEVRLHHAQRLLAEPSMSIKEIAHAVGFHDTNYFARLFRKRTGSTPSGYAAKAARRRAGCSVQ